MDRLARNAMLARQAGMSYGKWKAMQPVVPIVKEEKEIPENWKTCPVCGTRFPPKSNKRFCNYECQHKVQEKHKYEYKKKRAAYMRNYRADKKEAQKDGK